MTPRRAQPARFQITATLPAEPGSSNPAALRLNVDFLVDVNQF
jgi:hypothetical protein